MTDNTQQNQVNINTPSSTDYRGTQTDSATNTPTPTATSTTQDSNNMALLNWLGCLFFGFIPPLVLFLVKKDDAYVQAQAKEALNWSITFFITYIGLWIVAMTEFFKVVVTIKLN